MAFTFSLNETGFNWATAMTRLINRLQNVGWILMGNGDGLSALGLYGGTFASPTAATLVLTTSSPGSEGVANANTNRRAWWWVRSPDGQRELTFQRDAFNSGADEILVKYAPVGGFRWGVGGYGDALLKTGSTMRITDAAGSFVVGDVGKTIRIEEAYGSGNNGEFVITAYISATQIEWTNAGGATEAIFPGKWFIDRPATATIAPAGHTEIMVLGTSRDPAAAVSAPFGGLLGVGTQKWDFIMGGASEDYAFAALGRNASGYYQGGLLFDRLLNPDPADLDPTVVMAIRSNSSGTDTPFKTSSSKLGDQRGEWAPKFQNGTRGGGVADLAWAYQLDPLNELAATRMNIPRFCNPVLNFNILNPGGVNPYDGNYDLVEGVVWASTNNASTGSFFTGMVAAGTIKGESQIIKAQGSTAGAAQLDTNAALTRIHAGAGFWLIWDGSTTPVL